MITIANPIYDSVFKYLMEDERAARIMLSALLQRNVVSLSIKRNEYTRASIDGVAVCRIDFAALVESGDGSNELVTIEMQKAWLPTEVARFRKYLADQYSDADNSIVISERPLRKRPMHIVTIYLLGHQLHELQQPITYVQPRLYDQYGVDVDKRISDVPFADGLIHDMIIVQIPLLTNMKVVSHLDKLMSIFDQAGVLSADKHKKNVDASDFTDFQPVVDRLASAYADSDTLKTMDIEDEYAALFDDYEQQIIEIKEALESQKEALESQKKIIDSQVATMDSQKQELASQKQELASQRQELASKNQELASKDIELENQKSALNCFLRSSVLAMRSAGLTDVAIAKALGVDLSIIVSIS